MTDDEIRAHLKPRHNWIAILGALAGAAGVAWGIARWAATTPTRPEFEAQRDEMVRVRIELPVINAKIERVDQSQQRMEKALDRIEAKQDEARTRRR